ncbi:MAG: hypothetical protein AABY32_03885 [Nanoarchaeota archaeon]
MDKSVYLSIDLDFWSEYSSRKSSDRFFNKIINLDLPLLVVDSHEEIVDHVNTSGANILINMDSHSDIIGFYGLDDKKEELSSREEYNWANHVSWRANGSFVWLYPTYYCYEDGTGIGTCCDVEVDPFKINNTGWKSISLCCGVNNIDFNSIRAVSISISKEYTNIKTVKGILKYINSFYYGSEKLVS